MNNYDTNKKKLCVCDEANNYYYYSQIFIFNL